MLHRKLPRFLSKIFLAGIDLVHFPCTDIWENPRGVKVVVTLHDLAPLHFPGRFFSTSKEEKRYRLHLEKIIRDATLIVTVSDSTRQDLLHSFTLHPDKVRTVYNAVDPSFLSASGDPGPAILEEAGLRQPYFLFVGTFDFRKNVPLLLKAFSAYRREGGKSDLVMVGRQDPANPNYYPPVGPLLDQMSERDHVRSLSDVGDQKLPAIYRGARALVFPSSFEGFGYPILEAMASGIPVIAANRSSLPEIAGGAACLVDLDEEAIAQAMLRVEREESFAKNLVHLGQARVKGFLPERYSNEMINLYREVCGRPQFVTGSSEVKIR